MKPLYNLRGWFLAAVVVAVGGWYLFEPAREQALVRTVKRDDWRLEPLPKRTDNVSLAVQISSAGYWGAPPPATAASAAPPPPPRWRIAGLLGHGNARSVLLSYPDLPDKEPQVLRVGDTLPNGERILKIEDREFQVQAGNEVQTRLIQALAPSP